MRDVIFDLGTVNLSMIEVFVVEAIGASAGTPLHSREFIGKRTVRPVKSQKPYDRLIAAPVSGDSWLEAGVMDGDVAILKLNFEPHEVRPGQPVIVKCPAGLLMKTVELLSDGRVCLRGRNSRQPDLFFDPADIEVQAIVVRIERVVHDWS